MTESQRSLHIHILVPEDEEDAELTDLGLVNIGGERHLFLKPQSFDSAVRHVRSAMPDLPLEQVERLVREHSEFKDFDELLGPAEPVQPLDITPTPDESPKLVRRRGRAKQWVLAAALAPALAGSWALGYVTAGSPAGISASAPDASPSPSSTDAPTLRSAAKPFAGPGFLDFSEAGQIDCEPIANLEAECTDADGMVMSSKAATGPDSTIFTFSYGSEQIGLRIFEDADYAETWVRQDATTELYPHLSRSGRYVLWGTDKSRLSQYMDLLRASTASPSAMSPMGSMAPLPPRLAALTLGTLGLDERDVETILFSPSSAPVDESVLLAAQAVLGVQTTAPRYTGGDDIVAIAAGVDRPSVVTPPEHKETAPSVVTIVDRGTPSAPNASTDGTQPTTTVPDLSAEPTASVPQVEQPEPARAPVEPPAPEPSTPLPVVEEEQPEQAGEPSAEVTPAAPSEQTPSESSDEPEQSVPSPPVAEGLRGEEPVRAERTEDHSTPSGLATEVQDGDLLILDSAWTVAS
ncbi:hypothetical protein [Streptomyces sp. NPDC015125]|uniref:hypothetical protein n=1 Tax=Streptomyces sp. NPDC015125 TaxID=3364938 RepID=UPI0036FF7E76